MNGIFTVLALAVGPLLAGPDESPSQGDQAVDAVIYFDAPISGEPTYLR